MLSAPREPLSRPRRIAVGDPQAPFSRFLAILDRHGLLTDAHRLRDEVALVSIGDHFDWGRRADRAEAARSGLALLRWLAEHPPDQVAIVAGNHDLARVGELVAFDDARFAETQADADTVHRDGASDPERERAFRERHPELPTAGCVARDFATFRVEQRALVTELLRARRFCLGVAAADDLLLCHAGVTSDDLRPLGLDGRAAADARAVAGALNAALDAAVAVWDGRTALRIEGLHEPGSARGGEGRGILFQRPSQPVPDHAALFAGRARRRFDPRALPAGLTQAVGHIRDAKCRSLLGSWCDAEPARDGPLRHLRAGAAGVRYARGRPGMSDPRAATLLFVDGGMQFVADVRDYELLDLDTRGPARAG